MALLEAAFEREVNDALSGGLGIFQTQSKLAEKMAADGLLEPRAATLGRPPLMVTVRGYGLTHAGRMLYCMSCEDTPSAASGNFKDAPAKSSESGV